MDANQLWVRNAKGQVWGPLPPKQILLLLERQLISGVTEASRDGRRYSPAAQEPALAPALAKLAPAADARPRTVSGVHEVWRPSTGTIPVQGAPARSSASVSGGVTRTPVAGVPATPGVPRVSTPMQPLAAAIAAHPPAPTIIQAVPPAGRLEEHSPFKLYYLIAAAETQGRLVLGEGQTAVSVWFKSGTPHAIESQALGLGPYLIEQRVLTAAQLASAQPQIQKSGGDVASGLFTAGLLNPQTAFPLIQQHAQTLLQRGLLLDHGPFAFDPSVPVPASGFQLGQRWQLLSGAARRLDTIRLRTWLHGREHLIPQVAGSTSELQLTAQETRLLTHVDGGRTLELALTLAGPQTDSLLRLMLLLTEIDRVTWTGSAGAPGVVAPVTRRTTSVVREAAPPTAVTPPPAVRRTSSVALEPPVPTVAGAQTVRRTTSVIREPGAAPVISPAPPVAPRVAAAVAPPPKAVPAPTGGLSGAIAKAMAENAAPKPAPAPAPSAAAPKPVAAAPGARPATVAPKPAVPVAKPAAPVAAKPARAPIKTAPGQGGNLNLPALAKFLEELKAKDFFARLKVERSQAPIAMLKSNYFQLAKLYHPDTVPPDGPEEARRMKADILALLNEANGVLSDDAKRIDYLAETEAREAMGDVDVEAVLMAEEDFQQAILLTRARKFSEALTLIEKCIKANPKEGEFYAWRGYCRFFGSQDKRSFRDMAIEDQQKALSLNPKCTVAWLFQGQIWKLLEDVPKAKEAFQKTLELDPNNVDAQRELRLFEQRKK